MVDSSPLIEQEADTRSSETIQHTSDIFNLHGGNITAGSQFSRYKRVYIPLRKGIFTNMSSQTPNSVPNAEGTAVNTSPERVQAHQNSHSVSRSQAAVDAARTLCLLRTNRAIHVPPSLSSVIQPLPNICTTFPTDVHDNDIEEHNHRLNMGLLSSNTDALTLAENVAQTDSKGNDQNQDDHSDFVVPFDISHWGYTHLSDESTIRASFSSSSTSPSTGVAVSSITSTPSLTQTPTLGPASNPPLARRNYVPYRRHSAYYQNTPVTSQHTTARPRYPSQYPGGSVRSAVPTPVQSPAFTSAAPPPTPALPSIPVPANELFHGLAHHPDQALMCEGKPQVWVSSVQMQSVRGAFFLGRCRVCDWNNQTGMRYCTGCYSALCERCWEKGFGVKEHYWGEPRMGRIKLG